MIFGGLQLEIPWPSFWWLLLLSLTSQTIGWLLITSSLPRLPAAVSSLLLLLQPAAAMLLAAAVLGEQPSLLQVAGALLVCCGILGASLAATSQRGRPPGMAGTGTGTGTGCDSRARQRGNGGPAVTRCRGPLACGRRPAIEGSLRGPGSRTAGLAGPRIPPGRVVVVASSSATRSSSALPAGRG